MKRQRLAGLALVLAAALAVALSLRFLDLQLGALMSPRGLAQMADYARAHPERDFGLHLCQTSEWKVYRWGPVAPRTEVPGLIDPDGYFWHEVPQVYASAKPEEAYVEARAQVKRAVEAWSAASTKRSGASCCSA